MLILESICLYQMTTEHNCKTCNEPLRGAYCHVCGEKRLMPSDRSFKVWLQETLSNFVQFDGKVIKTLVALITRPVRLASDYFEGRRRPYLRMINLFFIANLLYFLTPGLQTFKTSLYVQMNDQPYSAYVLRVVENYLEREELDINEFKQVYDAKTLEVSKLMLVLLVVLLGFVVYLLFAKQLYLSDALNLALQFWSAYILMFILPFSLVIVVGRATGSLQWLSSNLFSELTLSIATFAFSGVYLWLILRRFSKSIWLHFGKIVAILASFFFVFVVYRAVLFLITWLLV
ncbi:DUF3667 domain-containing protein [Roseivirga pacifica]